MLTAHSRGEGSGFKRMTCEGLTEGACLKRPGEEEGGRDTFSYQWVAQGMKSKR